MTSLYSRELINPPLLKIILCGQLKAAMIR